MGSYQLYIHIYIHDQNTTEQLLSSVYVILTVSGLLIIFGKLCIDFSIHKCVFTCHRILSMYKLQTSSKEHSNCACGLNISNVCYCYWWTHLDGCLQCNSISNILSVSNCVPVNQPVYYCVCRSKSTPAHGWPFWNMGPGLTHCFFYCTSNIWPLVRVNTENTETYIDTARCVRMWILTGGWLVRLLPDKSTGRIFP